MKRIIYCIAVLICSAAICQGYITVESDTVFYNFNKVIAYYTANLSNIVSVDGHNQIAIPIYKVLYSDSQTAIIHGDILQYNTIWTDTLHSIEKLKIPEACYCVFDFDLDTAYFKVLTNSADRNLYKASLSSIVTYDYTIRLKRWNDKEKRERWMSHMLKNGYIWTKAVTDTITLYKDGDPWVYIPPIWKKWIVPTDLEKVKFALKKLKPYYISGQVKLKKEL